MSGSVAIVARIVDTAGNPVRPSSIESVSYSVGGDERFPLRVDRVILDSLEADESWTVDREGFNFRHEFELDAADAAADRGRRREVRYELTPFDGPTTLMRFQIGVT